VGKGGYCSTIGICESKVSLVISKLFRLLSSIRPYAQTATAIWTAQGMFSDNEIEGRMAYIKANFGSLPSNITCLQEKGGLENPTDLIRKLKMHWKMW
jgi:hypothetical protein